jgi:hypothetical protein
MGIRRWRMCNRISTYIALVCQDPSLSDDTFMSDPGVSFMELGMMRFVHK